MHATNPGFMLFTAAFYHFSDHVLEPKCLQLEPKKGYSRRVAAVEVTGGVAVITVVHWPPRMGKDGPDLGPTWVQ